MQLTFYKYQGTGNDFVIIDNREGIFPVNNPAYISFLCDRRVGIGADGLLLLENEAGVDFKMVYFNSDGNESTMCGNGGRCLVAFAKFLGIIKESAIFNAIDGRHTAKIDSNNQVRLQMQNVSEVREKENYTFLNTGSPHHVQLVDNLQDFDVYKEGAKLRYGLYGEKGSNINFVEAKSANEFRVRTYERGVENETLSCGTGVTAVALAMHYTKKLKANLIRLHVEGGVLDVAFDYGKDGYTNVYLVGPTELVFKGEVACKN